MAESRLHKLSARGQSVWIDYLSRDLLETGELKRMMDEDAVVGVTSNPTIFQKAISQGSAYDEQIASCSSTRTTAKEIFLHLAVRDVESALDLLSPVYERNAQRRLRVDRGRPEPRLRHARPRIEEAMRLHEWIDRPNLFVKIPGTEPGLQAIEDCIADGRNINVTLIFSLQRHSEVDGGLRPRLERLVEGGGDPSKVASVASFFVSRVDTEADKRLEAIGTEEALALRGQARDRERPHRVRALPGGLLRRALGGARGEGRAAAALPVGLHVHEEPGVPRRALRRGADRPAHGEHDAGGDDPGLPGSRRSARRHRRGRPRRGPARA